MSRPDLGTKRTCPTTGRKFYDLNRDPIVSPYTGEVLPSDAVDPVAARPAPGRPATAVRTKPPADEEDEVVEAGPELVSLEDVEADEEKAGADEEGGDDAATDDTFLEEEEEGGDVSDLIEGDIEDEEEG